MKFRPLHDRLVVRRLEGEAKTAGGIIIPDTAKEERDIYFTGEQPEIISGESLEMKHNKRLVDAISDGLMQSMERFDNLVIMGQDVAEYGGVFKITEGFVQKV